VGAEDVAHAQAVREALRALLFANNGEPLDPDAPHVLDAAAQRAGLVLRFEPGGGSVLVPGAAGVDGALGRLLTIASDAMADGIWDRLKACRAETCQWAFYDATRNRSGAWCSMRVCGNREKVRTYRARQSSA
jgi:predicted RNA-binding Zn ribbon-like protein